MNEDSDLDAFDPDFLEDAQRRQASAALVNSMDADPDKVARSIQISRATGIPSPLVHADQEGVEAQAKLAINSKLVADNEFLQRYVASHPLAAGLSYDDIAQMDVVSRELDNTSGETGLAKWLKSDSVAQSFMEGFGSQPLGSSALRRPEDTEWLLSHPALGSVALAAVTPVEFMSRAIGGMIHAGHDGLEQVFGKSLADEAAAVAEWAMTRGDMPPHMDPLRQGISSEAKKLGLPDFDKTLEQAHKIARGLRLADPWTRIGRDPPPGIHPLIDKTKELQAKEDIDAITSTLQEAQKSATRERDPDFFANAIRLKVGEREIGIDADAIRTLYGDKVPEAGDNLLGWIPDLGKKLDAAELTGGDVSVPLADWLAKADPEIHKTLADDIRARDAGLTINETKIEAEPKTVGPDTLQQIRGAAGLEPMEMAGDRKIELRLAPKEDPQKIAERHGYRWEGMEAGERQRFIDYGQGIQDVEIYDEYGKNIGMINLSIQKDGKRIYIDMINAGPKEKQFYQPNFLGPSLIMDMRRQLKAMFPGAEEVTGHRVSGARDKAGEHVIMDPKKSMPVVKLEEDSFQHDKMRDLLNQFWEPTETGHFEALRGPMTLDQQVLSQAIEGELRRIIPQKLGNVSTPLELRRAGGEGKGKPGGFYSPAYHRFPEIMVALDREAGAMGIARHEAIHMLRGYGFFKPEEWSTLERAARDEGWIKKYRINTRYGHLDTPAQLEEAIAEGFRHWSEGQQARPEVHGIFERLKQLFESIKTKFKELTGKDLNYDEIFQKTMSGEVGAREGTEAIPHRGGNVPFDIKEMQDRESPKAANDIDAKAGARQATYDAAARKQQVDRLIDKDTKVGDFDYWQKIAEAEGHVMFKSPNGYAAARAHSEGGKTTMIMSAEGRRVVYKDGVKVARELNRDVMEPKLSVDGIFEEGKGMGVTQSHMDRLLRNIDKRNKEDREYKERKAELSQRRRSNKEYKERRTILRDEVAESLRNRPDLAVDALFAKQKIKINPAYLTEDQRARLPKDYLQTKDGINPDDLAPYFGYTSGDAMVERLGVLTEDRRRAGMSQRDYFNRVVDVETDRRLNQEFGNREQNILDEAKDQALSETQLNMVHEETLRMAEQAGEAPQFTKEQVRSMVKDSFDQQPIGSIKSDKFLQASGKIGKKIEEALNKGDFQAAYRLSQQRHHAVLYAKFARDYEKARASLDRTAKTFRKREVPSVPADYTNWIHDLLLRVGKPVNRSVQDLAENIARQPETSLRDFVEAKEAEWMGERELPVADYLLDPGFRKGLDSLTHQEFMGFKNSIDALVKAGRDTKKIYVEGEARDREQTLGEMRGKLEARGYKPSNVEPSKLTKLPRVFWYGLHNMETFMNRLDMGNPRGIFNRTFVYPLADAANGKARLQREIAVAYKDLPKPKDLDKKVDAPFPDPMTRTVQNPDGEPGVGWAGGFRRSHVLQMLNHAGNKSNWNVLAKGYGADPAQLMQWLIKNTTPEDWARAQKLGDTVFGKLIDMADRLYERMTGATIEKIQLEPFENAHGKFKGWYHPLVADAQRKTVWVQDDAGQWSQKSQGKKETLNDEDFFHFSTANGYTKRRTGAIYPLDLNFSMTPTRIKQMIHDISFREVIHETQKIFSDKRFREDVAKFYGSEYADGLMPYLRSVAGAEGINSSGLATANAVSEFLRQNVISTYIGMNPFTVLKHGPTAAVMSSREVGRMNFFNAVKTLYAQAPSVTKATHDFVLQNSEEIQRRERHWQDTIAGQGREITGAGNLREKVIEAGSAAVAWSDMVSAKPTWLAAYNKYQADGLTHGESVSLADRAVRRAHGSTAETNQPPLVRGGGPLHSWLTSVYGFFGTAMQRRIETMHKLNDAWELGREKEIKQASKKLGSAFVDFMTYMVWPTIVEEAITGIGSDDHRTWGSRLISGATMGAASSVLYLRDLVHGAVSGHEPGVGMLSSALHDLNNVVRDLYHGKEALNKQHAGKTLGDMLTVVGEGTGVMPKIVGNAARYGVNVMEGQEKPKGISDVLLGVTKGTQKRKVEK